MKSSFLNQRFSCLGFLLLGILFITGPFLSGCSSKVKEMFSACSDVQQEDEDEIIVIDLAASSENTEENEGEFGGGESENLKEIVEWSFEKDGAEAALMENSSADKVVLKSQNAEIPQPENVILMIADGAGFGAFYCAADFLTGSPQGLFYQQKPWYMTSVATFHKKSFYDVQKDWADFKNLRVPFYEKEPAFIPPDSASTGTALMTGIKTRNGRVGIGPNDERLETITELFRKKGGRTGAVTSFQIASATMAATAAHDPERKNGQKLFAEMFLDGNLDVIIGAGHPEFNDDGQRREAVFEKDGPSEELWGKIRAGFFSEQWTFAESRESIQAIAERTPDRFEASGAPHVPLRLLALAPTANSFQCHRKAGSPLLTSSPTLAQTALAALNILAFNPQKGNDSLTPNTGGFFLLVEGGAVDAANDANDLVRCVEEMADFNQAVAAVCDWVEKYSSWEKTLVIVTADHDNGAIYGPEAGADGIPKTAPIYQGKGILPVAKYYSDDHTKQLVPIYARGIGAERLVHEFTDGIDEKMGTFWNYDGRFIDNTAVFKVMTGQKQ